MGQLLCARLMGAKDAMMPVMLVTAVVCAAVFS